MKAILLLALGFVMTFGQSLASDVSSTNASLPETIHDWEYITYPMTPNDGWAPGDPFFIMGYGEKKQGFRLDIDGLPSDFFKTHHITARLHRAGGEVVDPTALGKELLNSPISVQTASRPGDMEPDCQVMTFFPWGPNTLEESWIEVSTGTERYWLEIPYGFDRNSQDPLPPPMPGGPPKMIPAMRPLTSHDHLVRYLTVQYDLGKIHDGWSLSLTQANSGNGQSEAVVDCLKNTPHLALRVLDLNGAGIGGGGLFADNHLPQGDGQTRDAFLLGRKESDVRCWGQIEITVDDKSYRVVIPSSLYKYTHGHAAVN